VLEQLEDAFDRDPHLLGSFPRDRIVVCRGKLGGEFADVD